jgi:hypothetical protein
LDKKKIILLVAGTFGLLGLILLFSRNDTVYSPVDTSGGGGAPPETKKETVTTEDNNTYIIPPADFSSFLDSVGLIDPNTFFNDNTSITTKKAGKTMPPELKKRGDIFYKKKMPVGIQKFLAAKKPRINTTKKETTMTKTDTTIEMLKQNAMIIGTL